jgi:mono/diheme cytochrome c family protein
MRRVHLHLVLGLALLLPIEALAAGSAERGLEIAERWCSHCHLVSPAQAQALADVPSFMAVAEGSAGLDWLATFLADPHPVMPDMSLTRQEIQDLVAYFESLRN